MARPMLDTPLPHVVPLEGGSNFRDLGGYRTADGATVRRGTVFRSAHLGGLTDDGPRRAGQARRQDHRRPARRQRSCRDAAPDRGPRLQRRRRPYRAAASASRISGAVADGSANPLLMMQFLTDHYRDYPRRCAPGFRTLFATLSDGTHRPAGVPLHRRQGPHGLRLGAAAHPARRPWDDVMEDYLRTNDLWTGHVGRYPELDIDTRAAIIEARTPYLEAAFDVVRADFGGPEAFAEKARSASTPTRARAAEGGFAGIA